MALPANSQAAPATGRTTPRWVSGAMLILFYALLGGTLTLFVLLLRFGILRPGVMFPQSSSPEMKFFLVASAPYVLSMLLLLAPNSYARGVAAGIATASAAVFTYWEGLLFAVLVLNLVFFNSPSMREPGPPLAPTTAVVLVSLLCNVAVAVSSIVLMAGSWRALPGFVLGVFLAGCYAYGVYSAMTRSEAKHSKAVEDVDRESTVAFNTVESISWCAIEYSYEHREDGYPASLDAIKNSSSCKRPWSVSDVPHYSVSYEASRDASGRVTAFAVKATTPWNALRAPRNAESNQSGVALIQYQDPHDNRYPNEIGTGAPLGDLQENRWWFRDYAKDHKQLGFPRKFADVPNSLNLFRQHGSSFLSESAIRSGHYLFTYSPAAIDRTGKTNSYELRATCQAYGESCLHSFLLTSAGGLFVTTANRPATTEDTLLAPCPRGRPTTFCIQE